MMMYDWPTLCRSVRRPGPAASEERHLMRISRLSSWLSGGTLIAVAALIGGQPVPGGLHDAGADRPRPGPSLGVWEAPLQGTHGVSPDATVRQIAQVSVGVAAIRIRLGNPFGSAPVVVRSAWAGRTLAPGSATLAPGTNRRLTFGGR